MSEHIVDLLKMIEVEAHHGKTGSLPLGLLEGLRQMLVEGRAVWKIRQWIVVSQMRDTRLCALAFSHIFKNGNDIQRFAVFGDHGSALNVDAARSVRRRLKPAFR